MIWEEELQELTHTYQKSSHKFRTLAKIFEDEAHENNLIRMTNQVQVLIKTFKYEGFMSTQVKKFIQIMDMEDQKYASTYLQGKISRSLDFTSNTTLHLDWNYWGKISRLRKVSAQTGGKS